MQTLISKELENRFADPLRDTTRLNTTLLPTILHLKPATVRILKKSVTRGREKQDPRGTSRVLV